MIDTTTTIYRTCRVCKSDKPLDAVHYRVFSAVSHRFATACLACEIELAARRGETLKINPVKPVIPRETPPPHVGLGGTMHSYVGVYEDDKQISNNPTGRNGATNATRETAYQSKTIRLWLEAIQAVAERHGIDSKRYDHECDLLWCAIPRDDGWKSEGQHKAFQSFALGVIGGQS